MKLFTKAPYLILISSFLLLLTACGEKEVAAKSTTAEGTEPKKVLKVGATAMYPPFVFVDIDGVPKGFDVDVLTTAANAIGYEVEWNFAEFSSVFGMLDAKKVDIIASSTAITPERLAKYDFSDPYFFSGTSLIVREDNNSINSLDDLKGKKVGVLLGNTMHSFLEDWNSKNGNEIIITPYQDGMGAFNEVALGRVEAFIDVKVTAAARLRDEGLPLKFYSDKNIENHDFGFPVRREAENREFLAALNAEINKLHENGTIKELSDKWAPIDIYIPHEK